MYQTGIDPNSLNTLKKISQTKLGDKYYLAGGTACALYLNHRLSFDLDYFSPTPLKPEDIRNTLAKLGQLEIFQNDEGTFNGQLDKTKVSFFIYPYSLLDQPEKFENTSICSLKDLACMKFESISSRGVKRDFVDLYYIAQKYPLIEMFTWFKQKYRNQNISVTHVLKSLVYFDDAEDNPDPMMTIPYDWSEIRKYFTTTVPLVIQQLGLL